MPSWLGKKLARIALIIGAAVSWSFGFLLFFAEPARDGSRITQDFAYFRMKDIMHALEHFRADCGRYPSAAEGVEVLVVSKGVPGWKGSYITDQDTFDPWHRRFIYHLGQSGPEVISYGADGRPGASFLAIDLTSQNSWNPLPETQWEIDNRAFRLRLFLGSCAGFLVCVFLLGFSFMRGRQRMNHQSSGPAV